MTTLERPIPSVPAGPDGRRPGPRPSAAAAVLLLSVAVYLWLCWRLREFVTDDAWISVRYAENLARGHGFAWNPGGPRVEGYSNPLLVAVEALADRVGLPAVTTARGLGVLSGLACLLVVHLRGRQVVGRTGAAAAALLIACSAPFALWAVGGLETLPVALLLTVATVELAREDGGRVGPVAGALALLPWLRPEGLAAAAVLVVLSEAAGVLRPATRRAGLRRLLVLAGVPAASQVLLEVVRLAVYGHLLPNPVLYKAGQGQPFAVTQKFLAQGVVVLILAVAGLALAQGRQRLLAVPTVVYLIGSVGVLDSVNAFSRFVLPVWPQVALLAGLGVSGLGAAAEGRRRTIAVVAVVAAGGLALLALPPGDLRRVGAFAQDYHDCRTTTRESMAAWLRTTPPGTTYSISDAGLVPARAGGRTAIDSFFLNEALLQETGKLTPDQQAAEVFRRRPDVIVVAGSDPGTFRASYPTDQLIHDGLVGHGYHRVFAVTGGPGCSDGLVAFQR